MFPLSVNAITLILVVGPGSRALKPWLFRSQIFDLTPTLYFLSINIKKILGPFNLSS